MGALKSQNQSFIHKGKLIINKKLNNTTKESIIMRLLMHYDVL